MRPAQHPGCQFQSPNALRPRSADGAQATVDGPVRVAERAPLDAARLNPCGGTIQQTVHLNSMSHDSPVLNEFLLHPQRLMEWHIHRVHLVNPTTTLRQLGHSTIVGLPAFVASVPLAVRGLTRVHLSVRRQRQQPAHHRHKTGRETAARAPGPPRFSRLRADRSKIPVQLSAYIPAHYSHSPAIAGGGVEVVVSVSTPCRACGKCCR